MFYPHIILLITLLLIVGVLSNGQITKNKNIKYDYFKVETVYQKEFLIKEAVERYIYNNWKTNPLGLLINQKYNIDKLKENTNSNYSSDQESSTELSQNFKNSNGLTNSDINNNSSLEDDDDFEFLIEENKVIIYHKIKDTDTQRTKSIRNIYLNHYKRLEFGIEPQPDPTDSNLFYHEYQLSNKAIDILKNRESNGNGYIPVGALQAFLANDIDTGNCPIGWLKTDNSLYEPGKYPVLAKYLGVSDTDIINNIPHNLPDLRGVFLRNIDETQTRDKSGRGVNMFMRDQTKGFSLKSSDMTTTPEREIKFTGVPSSADYKTISHTTHNLYSGTWGTGISNYVTLNLWWNDEEENYPKNVSVRYCIKADYN